MMFPFSMLLVLLPLLLIKLLAFSTFLPIFRLLLFLDLTDANLLTLFTIAITPAAGRELGTAAAAGKEEFCALADTMLLLHLSADHMLSVLQRLQDGVTEYVVSNWMPEGFGSIDSVFKLSLACKFPEGLVIKEELT